MTEAADPAAAAPAEPAATFPLLRHLDGLMQDLRERIPAALSECDAEAIHQSRVATRRMKAALDLMELVLRRRPRRAFGRVLRTLRRRLGPLRDADVMIEHLQEIGAGRRHVRAMEWLSQRFCRERDDVRRDSAKRRPPGAVLEKMQVWQPVRQEIIAAREAVDTLLAESLHLQLDIFAEQADRLITGAAEDSASPDARQDPHELRISGKALRYTLEMAVVEGHDLPESLTKTFKKMQDALGLWHDYVVLGDRAARTALDEQLGHHEPQLMCELLDLLCEVLGRSTDELNNFKQLWRDQGGAIGKAIRSTFPLTRPSGSAGSVAQEPSISESKTDRDPSGSGAPAGQEGCPPAGS